MIVIMTAMPATSAALATTPAHRTMVLTTALTTDLGRHRTTPEAEVVRPPALTHQAQDLPPQDRARLPQAPTRARVRHPAAPAHPLDQATAHHPVLQHLRRLRPHPRIQTADRSRLNRIFNRATGQVIWPAPFSIVDQLKN